MKQILIQGMAAAWRALAAQGLLPAADAARIEVVPAKDARHGDFACNLALILASEAGLSARDLAARLTAQLPEIAELAEAKVAGPGFINFTLRASARAGAVDAALEAGADYGHRPAGSGARILLEYVSANPTGPLHVGHGRGAALGSCLARILRAAGHTVECEYFINDAGRQMDLLALSVWLRYLELCGEPVRFPAMGYQGDYIHDIAADIHRARGDVWQIPFESVVFGAPDDGPDADAAQAHLDALVASASRHLDGDPWRLLAAAAADTLLARIRRDLEDLGVAFDHWQSERARFGASAVAAALAPLQSAGHLYERDGALWFRASEFGDEKDRVVRRGSGQWTYFATDIAYHADKLARGYDHCINIWGADHHGYAARLRAAVRALGGDDARLELLLVQFVHLYRGAKRVPMSTRDGQFATLRELQQEVGADAARFFYVLRGADQHLDFDLQLAVAQSADNPVYYVQYAHARICSVLEKLDDADRAAVAQPCDLEPLDAPAEQALLALLARYPEVLARCARERAVQHLPAYLRELAQAFHSYYNAVTLLVDDDAALRQARMRLILAVRTVLAGGLALLGIAAPERM